MKAQLAQQAIRQLVGRTNKKYGEEIKGRRERLYSPRGCGGAGRREALGPVGKGHSMNAHQQGPEAHNESGLLRA